MSFGSFDEGDEGEAMSDINMTPLIDVMLVLLVIFIITAPLLTGSLKLDLPKVDAPAAQQTPTVLNVGLRKDGQLYLADKTITLAQLTARFTTAAQQSPKTEVHISADAAVPYGDVARVMGAAQNAGLSRIGLITQPPAGSMPGAASAPAG
ncbi:MAG: biopolymer transporter ExbD [Thiomonas sp. 20-64-9]|jgi:biopolymer transport protein ExbD|uniref:ExbD/TolR family protein n=1 Tax=Thiomonas sp. TaxID=2047785 RepID=UPI000AA34A66|nr:biopolymer transporter ExbD [Thiomonas sp.]OYV30430.1 MAG: biopolymer transporter ExbD [Thiomonas sp. 20-64-9]